MAALHTGEQDLYKCVFCARTFRHKSHWYAHKHKEHPEKNKKDYGYQHVISYEPEP